MAQILKANGQDPETLDLKGLTLEKMQHAVEGPIERVPCRDDSGFNNRVLYVNEEGRMMGLPFNLSASMEARRTIVGNAILMTLEEEREMNKEEESEET
jgi:hypothetical protein